MRGTDITWWDNSEALRHPPQLRPAEVMLSAERFSVHKQIKRARNKK